MLEEAQGGAILLFLPVLRWIPSDKQRPERNNKNYMTTIVCDQEMGYMAADRQATSNDCEVAIECPKIRQIEMTDGIHLVASAGNESPATIFEDWYTSGDWDEPPDDFSSIDEEDSFTSIILTPNSEIWVADKFCKPCRIHSRWYAIGTGGPFAWAALVAGCGIERAMETAIKMDPHSGFDFDLVYLSDVNQGENDGEA